MYKSFVQQEYKDLFYIVILEAGLYESFNGMDITADV